MKCQADEIVSNRDGYLIKWKVDETGGWPKSSLTSWQNIRLMKWQIDEMASWWNGKLIKWKVDEMASWWNCKLMKWQVDEMANWWNGKLMKWQVDEMPTWWNSNIHGYLIKWPVDEMCSWPKSSLTSWQNIRLMKQPGTALNNNAACFPVEVEQSPLRHLRERHLRGKRQTVPESGYQDRFLPCRSVHFQSLILFSVIDIFWLK